MNCKEIRELLMTDYIDTQLDEQTQKEVKEHLNSCSECSYLEQALMETAREPFRDAERLKPPDEVWQQIKERVEEKQQRGILADIMEKLSSAVRKPKPVFALATVCVVILMAVVLTRLPFNGQTAYIDNGQETGILFYLAGEDDAEFIDTNGAEFETSIEEYLL